MMTGLTKKDTPEPVAPVPVPAPVKPAEKTADSKAKPGAPASDTSKKALKAEQDAQTLKAMQQTE